MHAEAARLRPVLVEAVRAAARVCRAVQADLATGDSVTKADASPVTVADLASQAIVCRLLELACPEIAVCGEEDASPLQGADRAALRASVVRRVQMEWPGATEPDVLRALDRGSHAGGATGRFFALDPIDGTKGFLRREQYAVALGLIEDGRVVAGVLGCPNLVAPSGATGVLVHSVRGAGTVASSLDGGGVAGTIARVSMVSEPARIRMCEPVESAHSDRDATTAIHDRLGVVFPAVRLDSQAKYAVLALGGAEVYLRSPTREGRRESIWDHAAGVVVVEEAGGCVTDLAGAPLDFSCGKRLERNRGIVATNGALHEAVLAAIAG